jgi:hypothetical protein
VIFSTDAARWLLVLHTVASVATVGALTHLVVWMRGYRTRDIRRHKAVRKFAVISLCLFAANFIIGNIVYPTYRTRIRAEYFDAPASVVDDYKRGAEEHARALAREGLGHQAPSAAEVDAAAHERALHVSKAVRWFDVKEHWVSFGLALTAGLTLILVVWRPKDADADGSEIIAPYLFGMAVAAAASVWIAGIIGILTAAWRGV